MRRCRICDEMFDDSRSHTHFLPSEEDTCLNCEVVILETILEYEEMDEWEEEKEDAEEG